MSIGLNSRSKIGRLTLAALIISLAAAGLAVGKRATNSRWHGWIGLANDQQPETRAVQMVRFTMDGIRLYPEEARARKGLVLLALRDFTGGEAELMIDGLQPQRSLKRDQEHWTGTQVYDLEVGRYSVYHSRYPNERVTLIIEP